MEQNSLEIDLNICRPLISDKDGTIYITGERPYLSKQCEKNYTYKGKKPLAHYFTPCTKSYSIWMLYQITEVKIGFRK